MRRYRVEKQKSQEIVLSQKQLRQMQMIQLEMLEEVDRICRKHNINYSLDGGSLLGAVRHKGFIPWDDDIDLIMLRKEYEQFYQICQNELNQEYFFLQEYRTDPYYYVGYPRIRRNHTVYTRIGHEHMKYHGGVFIDIFILDNVPDGSLSRILHRAYCFVIRKMLWSESGKILHTIRFVRLLLRLVSYIPRDVMFLLLNNLADRYNKNETKLVRHLTHPYPRPSVCPYGIPAYLLNDFIELEFEGKKFKAVKRYKEYLTLLYGNYMILPPEEKRKIHIHLSAFEPVKE